MLDFIYTCRSCVDQRCIDPCNYDSIKYDTKRREILINEATCTGCAACSVACPYGAIEMVNLDDPKEKNLKIRLDVQGLLKFGEGTGRKARLDKIASKCDHCATYSDQACVSRCPTAALFEIRPNAYDLPRPVRGRQERRPRRLRAHRRRQLRRDAPRGSLQEGPRHHRLRRRQGQAQARLAGAHLGHRPGRVLRRPRRGHPDASGSRRSRCSSRSCA